MSIEVLILKIEELVCSIWDLVRLVLFKLFVICVNSFSFEDLNVSTSIFKFSRESFNSFALLKLTLNSLFKFLFSVRNFLTSVITSGFSFLTNRENKPVWRI